jgi:hypothetical protein
MIEKLIQLNTQIEIKTMDDSSFKKYARVLKSEIFSQFFDYLENHTQIPDKDNYYIAHDSLFQAAVTDASGIHNVYGNMPVEFGYVNGNNSKLNAMEYHKSSELNIFLTPGVVMLARVDDINQNTLTTEHITAFFIPKRTVIELHSMTLHFSPCKVQHTGFKCGVILPFGTNMEFIKPTSLDIEENQLLFKTNKWIIVHPEHKKMIDLGAHIGIIGPNIEIKYE